MRLLDEIAALLDEIDQLLGAPDSSSGAPNLERVESTLTDGYAAALALEAERWRLERRIAELARGDEQLESPEELGDLSGRMKSIDEELGRLRSALRSLQQRARTLRDAAISEEPG